MYLNPNIKDYIYYSVRQSSYCILGLVLVFFWILYHSSVSLLLQNKFSVLLQPAKTGPDYIRSCMDHEESKFNKIYLSEVPWI